MLHRTVLLHESIEALALKSEAVVVDATLGSGGHAEEILRQEPIVKIIGIDADQTSLDRAKARLEQYVAEQALVGKATLSFHCQNFRNIDQVLVAEGVEHVDAILFDLGWNTDQFEGSGLGFSFQKDEPLVMTFATPEVSSQAHGPLITAHDIVNGWEEQNIADVIFAYGDERYAKRIARAIVEKRQIQPIKSTFELVEVISRAVPFFYRHGNIHFATRTFQALRIAVNDELNALKEALWKAFKSLRPGGRLVVITFHSLEDRIVKWYFREREEQGLGTILTKRPLTPSEEEIAENRRSRSAKLRILEKK